MYTKNIGSLGARFCLILVLVMGMLGAQPIKPVFASMLTVTNTNDSGAGSLRQAIASAVSGDTITFHSSLSGQTITLASTLVIDKDLVIDGSALASKISVSGNDSVTVFDIHSVVSLKNLIVNNGNSTSGPPSVGGGVINFGTLSVINSIVSGNSADEGGGIYNAGTLNVANSTISGNSADVGGGVLNIGTLDISESTFFGNTASQNGGGFISFAGDPTITNSTFHDNTASQNGGAIYSFGSLILQNSALYHNESEMNGAGIFAETLGDEILIANTTISENYADQAGSGIYDGGGIYVAGHSIIRLFNSTVIQNGYVATNEIVSRDTSELMFYNSVVACGGKASCVDLHQPPLISHSILGLPGENYWLDELADNGGPTRTMALYANSPLVDAGDNAICANPLVNNLDQRGVTRPYGSHCDIGAFELEYLTISGSAGVGGATLKYGHGLFTVADNGGNYSIKVLPGWSGTVIPVKQDYSFNPAKAVYTNIQSDQTDQSYIATANAYTYPGDSGDTRRVSVTSGGGQSDDDSYDPSISADGRYVAFMSYARNLINGDVSGATDILVYDNQTGETEVVSVHSDGVQFENNSYAPTISADGRYVAFVSFEWFGTPVVFVHDRHSGITNGSPFRGPPEYSASPSISADGRYIAYTSNGVLTDDGDTNNKPNIFVYDQWTTSLKRISMSSAGAQSNGDSHFPSISLDGRYVAFQSSATNLITGDTNGVEDIFVHDAQSNETTRISVNSSIVQANGSSFRPSISGDGRYVTFHSSATNLVGNDTNSADDVFVHDLQTGKTTRVSIDSNGVQGNGSSNTSHISSNGGSIVFRSLATNLIAGDTNGAADIFMYNLQTGKVKRVSIDSNGMQANGASSSSYASSFGISGDSKYLAFSSDATNLVLGDTNTKTDIFVHETAGIPIEVSIAGAKQGIYNLGPSESIRQSYPLNNGPVKVISTNAVPFVVAERDAWLLNGVVQSFSEMMGLPGNQVTDTYYFPWYNNATMDTQLRFANLGAVPTDITVTIAGVTQPVIPLAAGVSTRVSYPGINNGPVKVQSSGGVPIIVAERDAWLINGVVQSFSEMMGLPGNQLTDTYYFPWYNNVTMDTQLRFANLGLVPTDITVTIAGIAQQPITVAAGESTRVSYAGINNGPVKVTSSGGTPILVAERDAWLINGVVRSFSEMMGLPGDQLTDTYYFPWYNNVTMDTQLRFANLGVVPTDITVTIAGVAQPPITVAAGMSTRISYAGINNGPVKVQSSGGVPIIVAERDAWLLNGAVRSFSEMMGLPGDQLTDTYYFPWYNNVTMDTQLRFAVP